MTDTFPSSSQGLPSGPSGTPTDDERTIAILVHILSIFFWLIPALVIYLVKKDDSPFVGGHAREALNFQITITIVYVLLLISIVGWLLLWLPWVVQLVACIMGAVNASDRKPYRYPLTIRLVS